MLDHTVDVHLSNKKCPCIFQGGKFTFLTTQFHLTTQFQLLHNLQCLLLAVVLVFYGCVRNYCKPSI